MYRKWLEIDIHTHNRFTDLWNLSGTTRVNRYQKKHLPTHTDHGHQSSLSAFSIYYNPWHPPYSIHVAHCKKIHLADICTPWAPSCLNMFLWNANSWESSFCKIDFMYYKAHCFSNNNEQVISTKNAAGLQLPSNAVRVMQYSFSPYHLLGKMQLALTSVLSH